MVLDSAGRPVAEARVAAVSGVRYEDMDEDVDDVGTPVECRGCRRIRNDWCREGDFGVTPTPRKGRIATSLHRHLPPRRLGADERALGAAAGTRPAGLGCRQCQTLEIGSA